MNKKYAWIIGIVIVIILGVIIYSNASKNNSYDTTDVGTATTTQDNDNAATPFTLADVQIHNSKTSCYSAINGSVYDLTSWIPKHPGGADKILSICGKDGSSAFTEQHAGEPRPEQMLATFKIGTYAQ